MENRGPNNEPEFSDEDREEIESYARHLSKLGEKGLNEFIDLKCAVVRIYWETYLTAPTSKLEGISKMRKYQEAKFDAVIHQTRAILQFEGRDTISELDRDAIAAGWGSLFDPESKIRKTVASHGIDFFAD